MTQLVLYYSPGACSMAPHIVLEEIGKPFKLSVVVSRGAREGLMTATPEWRAVNPKGRIPALLGVPGDSGGAPDLLTEVPAITMYLAMLNPEAGLLPEDPSAVARALEWMNWLSSSVHATSYGQIWRAQRYSDDEETLEAIRSKGRRNLLDQHAYIERILADGREWALPSGYSIVDPYLLVFFRWGQRLGIDMRAGYPAWSKVTDRTVTRPAVQRVLEKEGAVIL